MSILNELFDKYSTDKGTVFDAKHSYGTHYDIHFEAYRDKPIKFLEIGIYKGNSIKAWREYFTKATIFGIDNGYVVPVDKTLNELNNVNVSTCDINTYTFESYCKQYGPFDIIVDDCSHKLEDQKRIFNVCYGKYLSKGGLYVIEDVGHLRNRQKDKKELDKFLSENKITTVSYKSNFKGSTHIYFIEKN